MWRRHARENNSDAGGAAPDPRRSLLMLALQEMAGSARGIVYDVPADQRPVRARMNCTRVSGGPAWQAYVRARRQMDDGALTLVISLRALDDIERGLVIDWGTAYANSFLLIEPLDKGADLVDQRTVLANQLDAALAATHPPEQAEPGWTRAAPVGAFLRKHYGRWLCWPSPPPISEAVEIRLDLERSADTVALRVFREIAVRFPQATFDDATARLLDSDRELFGGPVPRGRSAYRTRLGLPILHDPYCADRALRRMVNQGKISVRGRTPVPRLVFGYGSPVPAEMPDEDFERLIMV